MKTNEFLAYEVKAISTGIAKHHIKMIKKLLRNSGMFASCHCFLLMYFWQYMPQTIVNKPHFVLPSGLVMFLS